MLHVLQLFCDTCKDTCDGEAVPELHKELAGKRVLLVEDNELNREIAVELLEMQGLQVELGREWQVGSGAVCKIGTGVL